MFKGTSSKISGEYATKKTYFNIKQQYKIILIRLN